MEKLKRNESSKETLWANVSFACGHFTVRVCILCGKSLLRISIECDFLTCGCEHERFEHIWLWTLSAPNGRFPFFSFFFFVLAFEMCKMVNI